MAAPSHGTRQNSAVIEVPGDYKKEWDLDSLNSIPAVVKPITPSLLDVRQQSQRPPARSETIRPLDFIPCPEESPPAQHGDRKEGLAQDSSSSVEKRSEQVTEHASSIATRSSSTYVTAQDDPCKSVQSSPMSHSLASTRRSFVPLSSVMDQISNARPSAKRMTSSTRAIKHAVTAPIDGKEVSPHWIWNLLSRTATTPALQESHPMTKRRRARAKQTKSDSDSGSLNGPEAPRTDTKRSGEDYNVGSAMSQIISDMETLLSGALQIAKQQADKRDALNSRIEAEESAALLAGRDLQNGPNRKPRLLPSPEIVSKHTQLPPGGPIKVPFHGDIARVSAAPTDQLLTVTSLDEVISVEQPFPGRSDSLPSQLTTSSVVRGRNSQVSSNPEAQLGVIRDSAETEAVAGISRTNSGQRVGLNREPVYDSSNAGEPRLWSDINKHSKSTSRHQKLVGKLTSRARANSDEIPAANRRRSSSLQHSFVFHEDEDNDDEYGEDGEPALQSIHENSRPEAQRSQSRRGRRSPFQRSFSLTDRHHISIRDSRRFHLSRTHRRSRVARDWSTARKRIVATIACMSTALVGVVVGIYAGQVPAIQYQLADEHHTIILGNTLLYIGLAIPTLFFWSLPLLHGRKSYSLLAMSLFLPLQLPQAIIVGTARDPGVSLYRISLLLARGASGLALGFANINFKATLLDLFGASLQSTHPHQEIVHAHDVRRHGGGMGVWLGIWSWCHIGSIGVGFLIGACLTSPTINPAWGFWVAIILTALVLLLNVLMPEVRRSSHRRSMAEIWTGAEVTRRIARGEIMMHLFLTGPKWWWEEVRASISLMWRMFSQPGFFVLATYMGWVYGQIVMIVILLGALTSRYYHFKPPLVGACVSAIPIGALLAVPFEKASLFSRSRKQGPRTDSMTFEKRISWSSHLVRRAIFMIALPFAGMGYTLSSGGPPTHFMWPTFFAGLIGFLSSLAIAECNGLIMETFDTSDLQSGMSGRPPTSKDEQGKRDPRRTNFSCYPRISAALAITQTLGFIIAAAATGVGGAVERRLGAELATGVIAVILLNLTSMLIGVLWRSQEVQVTPSSLTNLPHGANGNGDDWRPIIIGHPSGKMRRMSLLELGGLSRWTEIRRHNRLLES